MGPVLPCKEQLAVAQSDAGSRIDAEQDEHVVNPVGWTLEFGKVTDGRLVEDEVGSGNIGVGVLASVFFVAESRTVTKAGEDFGERGAVGDFGLGLDPHLIHAGGVFVIRVALMGDDVVPSIFADTKNLTLGLEGSIRGVVQGVLLKGSGSLEMETRLVKLPFEGGKRGYRDLDFDFGALHGESIRLLGDRWRER